MTSHTTTCCENIRENFPSRRTSSMVQSSKRKAEEIEREVLHSRAEERKRAKIKGRGRKGMVNTSRIFGKSWKWNYHMISARFFIAHAKWPLNVNTRMFHYHTVATAWARNRRTIIVAHLVKKFQTHVTVKWHFWLRKPKQRKNKSIIVTSQKSLIFDQAAVKTSNLNT